MLYQDLKYKYLRVNILIIDYRGYGDSEGDVISVAPEKTEKGIVSDGVAALEHAIAHPKIDSSKIFITGVVPRGIGCWAD